MTEGFITKDFKNQKTTTGKSLAAAASAAAACIIANHGYFECGLKYKNEHKINNNNLYIIYNY